MIGTIHSKFLYFVSSRHVIKKSHNYYKVQPNKFKIKTFLKLSTFSGLVLAVSQSDEIENYEFPYINTLVTFLRSMKIATLISFDYSFSTLGLNESSPNYKVMMSRIHQRAADRLLNGCLKNGGSYIKLGQGLACMNHVLPIEYTATLTLLQDKCLKRNVGEVCQLFLEDFGQLPQDMYQVFNGEAIAAASLAQVFKATTKDGQKVAVKVQYIDLRNRFKSDVATIEFLLKIIGMVHKDFNFAWMLDDLKNALKQELDFLNEGKNAELCAKHLNHLGFVYIPQVRWDLSSKRVLVTEFIDAYKISDTEQLKLNKFSLVDIDTKLFQAFGEQIFQTGFVHADPHPGNVLIRKYKGEVQLVLLDHGLYEIISEKDRIALSKFWKAIVLNNLADMQKYSHELGVEDYEMFAEILTQVPLKASDFKLKTKYSEEDIQAMRNFAKSRFDSVMKVLKLMPSSLLLILRNLNTIRAIAQDHGDVINRYHILARCATKRSFETKRGLKKLFILPKKLYFEIKLIMNKLNVLFQKSLLMLLYILGRSPNTTQLMENISQNNL